MLKVQITPTSNAARRPGRAAEVRISAGRNVGCEGISPRCSSSALGSHEHAAACNASRTLLCPTTALAQQSAWAAEASSKETPQRPQTAGSSGPAAPRRKRTAVTYSTGVKAGPTSGALCHNHSWLHSGSETSFKRLTSGHPPACPSACQSKPEPARTSQTKPEQAMTSQNKPEKARTS